MAVPFGPSTTEAVTVWLARLAQGDSQADRDAGRRRCGDCEPARDPTAPQERDDVRPLRRCRVEDRRAQPRGRSGRDRGERQSCRGLVELGELLAALLALAQVPLVGLGLVRGERVERVRGGQVVGVHDVSVPGSPSSSRMRESPPNIRLLMVPSGWPSLSASSDWLNPP